MKTPGSCPQSIGVHWPASGVEASERGAVVRFVYGSVGTFCSQICGCDGWRIREVWEVCFRKKVTRCIHDMNILAGTIKVRPLEIISWSLG